jgi:hypothetical protein
VNVIARSIRRLKNLYPAFHTPAWRREKNDQEKAEASASQLYVGHMDIMAEGTEGTEGNHISKESKRIHRDRGAVALAR